MEQSKTSGYVQQSQNVIEGCKIEVMTTSVRNHQTKLVIELVSNEEII